MNVLLGQTRGGAALALLREAGLGEMTQPAEYPPRRAPWMLDNGAFLSWRDGRPHDVAAFTDTLKQAVEDTEPPIGAVLPDIVAGGLASLDYSMGWHAREARAFPGITWYLAVQDGMAEDNVTPHLERVGGVFVGGSLGWKLATGAAWAAFARAHGKYCHIGRVGTLTRLRWAWSTGATSCDSSAPLFSMPQLRRFLHEISMLAAQVPFAMATNDDVATAAMRATRGNTRRVIVPKIGVRCTIDTSTRSLFDAQ